MITVKYFASLRDTVGRDQDTIGATPNLTVGDVWIKTAGIALPKNTLMALNMNYVTIDKSVKDGDEVGFFPPVTGGLNSTFSG